MKRTALLFLITSLLTIACNRGKDTIVIIPDIEKNHLQQNHLFGNIKEITTSKYITFVEHDSLTEVLVSSQWQHYSSDGYLKSVLTFDKKGDTILKEEIKYNQLAQTAQVISHEKRNKKTGDHSFSAFKYDNFGHKTEEKYYNNDSLYLTILYKTDNKGNVVELTQQYDSLSLKNQFFYNSNGLVEQTKELDPFGKLFKYTTFEYDNYGDEVNRRIYNSKNKQIEYTYTVYNQQGHLLRVIHEDLVHNLRSTVTYSLHDKQGNWTLAEYKKGEDLIYIKKRQFIYY